MTLLQHVGSDRQSVEGMLFNFDTVSILAAA